MHVCTNVCVCIYKYVGGGGGVLCTTTDRLKAWLKLSRIISVQVFMVT